METDGDHNVIKIGQRRVTRTVRLGSRVQWHKTLEERDIFRRTQFRRVRSASEILGLVVGVVGRVLVPPLRWIGLLWGWIVGSVE